MATTIARNAYTASGSPPPGTLGNAFIGPPWSQGLDLDPASGRIYLAVADYAASATSGQARGTVRVGHSDDHGQTWTWLTLAAPPALDGRPQSSFRPTLAVRDGVVSVGLHSISDVPAGTDPDLHLPTIGTAYAVSLDGGVTFTGPTRVTTVRWNAAALERTADGPGLRDRAEFTADGHVFYVYGDGRRAAPPPSPSAGRSAIYGALIFPGTSVCSRGPRVAAGERDRGLADEPCSEGGGEGGI